MTPHQFVVVVADTLSDGQCDTLFARGGDVVVVGDGRTRGVHVKFDRDAPSLTDAIVSGVRDLEAVGTTPLRVRADDDLVTLDVVAVRAGRSREAVRAWSSGGAGPGGFPRPVDGGFGVTFYRWEQVDEWLSGQLGVRVDDPNPVLVAVDLALRLRAIAPRVPRMEAIRSLFAG